MTDFVLSKKKKIGGKQKEKEMDRLSRGQVLFISSFFEVLIC